MSKQETEQLRDDENALAPEEAPPANGEDLGGDKPAVWDIDDLIKDYRIIRTVSETATSVVYKAEEKKSKRRVAIKIIYNSTIPVADRINRANVEIEKLKHLRHPGIATFFDGGATEEGHSYFISDFVKGVSLDEYVGIHKISQSERLSMFEKICEAINYAHQNCLLHRDLRPSKIVVDGKCNPTIVGLGVTSATDMDVEFSKKGMAKPELRDFLGYKSPEQVSGQLFAIDIRSDLYSLGVLLYELLTEQLPYDLGNCKEKEVVRAICKELPRKPSSARLSVRGDLESIVLKALAKEPDERYQSAADLLQDMRNYFDNRPVQARTPGAFYEFRKLVSRHKSRFISVALTSAALIAFGTHIYHTTRQASRRQLRDQEDRVSAEVSRHVLAKKVAEQGHLKVAETARVEAELRAQAEANVAKLSGENERIQDVGGRLRARLDLAESRIRAEKAVARFFIDMFRGVSGHASAGAALSAQSMVDNGVRRASSTFKDQPVAGAAVLDGLGLAYEGLGLREKAVNLLRKAYQTRRQALGASNTDTISSMVNLAASLYSAGRLEEAEPLCRRIVEASTEAFGDDHPRTLTAMNNLAMTLHAGGKLAEAERVQRQALERRRRILGGDHRKTAMAMHQLGMVLLDSERLEEAESLFKEALSVLERKLPQGHWAAAKTRSSLGGCLAAQERFSEAEPILLASYESLRSGLGERHPHTQATLDRIIAAYNAWGKESEVERWLAKLPKSRRGTSASSH